MSVMACDSMSLNKFSWHHEALRQFSIPMFSHRQSVIGQCVVSIHRRYRNLHVRDCCFESQITWRVTCDCECRAKNIYAITVGRWISSPKVLLFIFIKLLKHECYGYHVRALFVAAARNIQIEFWMLLFSRADFLSDFYRELAMAFWLRANSAHFDLALILLQSEFCDCLKNSCRLESTRVCAKLNLVNLIVRTGKFPKKI